MKKLFFSTLVVGFVSQSLASSDRDMISGIWVGNAYHEKHGFFGNSKDVYKMLISIKNDEAILKLPEYKCETRLILTDQDDKGNFRCKEEHISGPCGVDENANTTLFIDGDTIKYKWLNGENEQMIAELKKFR